MIERRQSSLEKRRISDSPAFPCGRGRQHLREPLWSAFSYQRQGVAEERRVDHDRHLDWHADRVRLERERERTWIRAPQPDEVPVAVTPRTEATPCVDN